MNISENGVTFRCNFDLLKSYIVDAKHGTPDGTRTHNILLRRQTLYPVELPGRPRFVAETRVAN